MRAVKLFGAKDSRVVEVERPEPGPGGILLRVRAVAICPSDLRLWEDGHAGGTYPDHPYIQGHEFSGEVAALGEGVAGPAPGTRVAVTPLWSCGVCDLCRDGLSNVCRHMVFPSFPQVDGAMAEYMVVPAGVVEPLPAPVGFIEAALMEPLQASVHGTSLGQLQPGWPVAVVGAGIIGLGVLQAARAAGAEVFAADPLELNRGLAERFGAAQVVPYAAELTASLAGTARQPRVVFECSGHKIALAQSLELVRPGGLVVIIGVPHPDVIDFDTRVPRRHELHFVFSRRYRRETLPEAVQLVGEGKINLRDYPVRVFPLAQAPEAMAFANDKPPGIMRVVVEC